MLGLQVFVDLRCRFLGNFNAVITETDKPHLPVPCTCFPTHLLSLIPPLVPFVHASSAGLLPCGVRCWHRGNCPPWVAHCPPPPASAGQSSSSWHKTIVSMSSVVTGEQLASPRANYCHCTSGRLGKEGLNYLLIRAM